MLVVSGRSRVLPRIDPSWAGDPSRPGPRRCAGGDPGDGKGESLPAQGLWGGCWALWTGACCGSPIRICDGRRSSPRPATESPPPLGSPDRAAGFASSLRRPAEDIPHVWDIWGDPDRSQWDTVPHDLEPERACSPRAPRHPLEGVTSARHRQRKVRFERSGASRRKGLHSRDQGVRISPNGRGRVQHARRLYGSSRHTIAGRPR